MKIHADPITVNCKKVLAGLDLIGAKYELVHVDYFKAEQKEAAYLAINPNSSLPTMVDGDFVLWESNAILQYAADKTGNDAVYPKDLKTRADINRWLLVGILQLVPELLRLPGGKLRQALARRRSRPRGDCRTRCTVPQTRVHT